MPHVTVLERLFLYKEISKVDLLNKIAPLTKEGTLRAVIEIPAGSTEKWVVSKDGKAMLRKFENGEPSTINYLGYPANYGFIPKSLKPLNKGGEPLDVLVLGNILPRGMVVKVKPIGILKLTENGEQDDKLITLHESSPLYSFINTIDQLQEKYPGILEILKLWFENYKGAGKVKFHSLMDSHMAKNIVEDAIKSYKEHKEIN
jgi:inorganic pyrophosphatase